MLKDSVLDFFAVNKLLGCVFFFNLSKVRFTLSVQRFSLGQSVLHTVLYTVSASEPLRVGLRLLFVHACTLHRWVVGASTAEQPYPEASRKPEHQPGTTKDGLACSVRRTKAVVGFEGGGTAPSGCFAMLLFTGFKPLTGDWKRICPSPHFRITSSFSIHDQRWIV